jgi:superoxide dismutase, Cu-Zn family
MKGVVGMRSIRAVVVAAMLASVALATGIGAALASGEDDDDRSGGRTAKATIHDATGQRVGVAFFKERHDEVAVTAAVWRLDAGFHGFHVHSVGLCEPPFTSAEGHFNPSGADHGDHAGDLPSMLVNEDGTGELHFTTDRFSLRDLFDDDGSALMVHAGRDNYANIPDRYTSSLSGTTGPDDDTLATGDAGARAACGVIERSRRW